MDNKSVVDKKLVKAVFEAYKLAKAACREDISFSDENVINGLKVLKPKTLRLLRCLYHVYVIYPTRDKFIVWAKAHTDEFNMLHDEFHHAAIYSTGVDKEVCSEINRNLWEIWNDVYFPKNGEERNFIKEMNLLRLEADF